MKQKMIIYADMDDVICDYSSAHRLALLNNPLMPFPQSQYGFFAKLKPMPDAIESVQTILNTDHFDMYFLTAPTIQNPLSYTEKRVWIEDYFGLPAVNKLIICSNKGLLKGDLLIDDHTNGRGQECFEGRLIHFGSPDFPNWKAVIASLL